jgi:single-stranded-DNA-specific exonuclease
MTDADALREALGLSHTGARALAHLGFGSVGEAAAHLAPKLAALTSPESMKGRADAVERLARAVRARERVVVFGDYDADGITATAVLAAGLRAMGGDVEVELADRFRGGYGFSDAALERVLALKPGLVVTCDCGSTDHPRLDRLRQAGVDAIVIDHHQVPPEPLPVLAFLNPHQPGCAFPFKYLASCGLALSVVGGVRATLGVAYDLRDWLDVVAIGTIGDVAPLRSDNRILVRHGLDRLLFSKRPGLAALVGSRKVPFAAGDVSFQIAPKLNAPGRLGSPMLALRALLEDDRAKAFALVDELERVQARRKELDRQLRATIEAAIAAERLEDRPAIVVGEEGWHHGLVGIAAGRVAQRHGRPTVVLAFAGDVGTGSVRGPDGFPLHDALKRCADVLLGFGGHQAAAGVRVARSQYAAFREAFERAVEELTPAYRKPEGPPVVPFDGRDALRALAADWQRFEPCGASNAAPVVCFESVAVRAVRLMGKGAYAKLVVRVGDEDVGVWLGETPPVLPHEGARVTFNAVPRFDDYRGGGAVELVANGEVRPHG